MNKVPVHIFIRGDVFFVCSFTGTLCRTRFFIEHNRFARHSFYDVNCAIAWAREEAQAGRCTHDERLEMLALCGAEVQEAPDWRSLQRFGGQLSWRGWLAKYAKSRIPGLQSKWADIVASPEDPAGVTHMSCRIKRRGMPDSLVPSSPGVRSTMADFGFETEHSMVARVSGPNSVILYPTLRADDQYVRSARHSVEFSILSISVIPPAGIEKSEELAPRPLGPRSRPKKRPAPKRIQPPARKRANTDTPAYFGQCQEDAVGLVSQTHQETIACSEDASSAPQTECRPPAEPC
jgi:hypothetical protein